MILRELKLEDAVLMLEWMHDSNVVAGLQTDFYSKSIDDCYRFILNSHDDKRNLHLAIADDYDIYHGTVSLKNIEDNTAEFAIAMRSEAMGTGLSKLAMEKIIEIGFSVLNLSLIYWCVSPRNIRAVRFYDKNGYHRTEAGELCILGDYNQSQINEYIWYSISAQSY